MKYLDPKKDWRYHIKSAVTTFVAVFIPLFLYELSAYNLDGLKPEDITGNSLIAGGVAVLRVVIVAGARALLSIARIK